MAVEGDAAPALSQMHARMEEKAVKSCRNIIKASLPEHTGLC